MYFKTGRSSKAPVQGCGDTWRTWSRLHQHINKQRPCGRAWPFQKLQRLLGLEWPRERWVPSPDEVRKAVKALHPGRLCISSNMESSRRLSRGMTGTDFSCYGVKLVTSQNSATKWTSSIQTGACGCPSKPEQQHLQWDF